MKKIICFLLLTLGSFNTFSQSSKLIVEDLKPTIDGNKFPIIKYKNDSKVEYKINTLLQIENLEHLPNNFKKTPFEKVVMGEEGINGSTQFYGYKKNTTPENILSLMINGEATGAYSEEFEMYYNFDLRNGKKINLNDIITESGITIITKKLNKNVKQIIENFLAARKRGHKNKEQKDLLSDQMLLYTECLDNIEQTTIEYYKYYFKKDSITFVRERCSNHAMRAIDDLGSFELNFSYKEIKMYFSKYGLGLLSGDAEVSKTTSPEGKFYKGKINDKYSITALLSKIYPDKSIDMKYWYNKSEMPIVWNGNLINNHFTLIEYDKYDEEQSRWIIKAKIEADLINNKIIGTWANAKTNEIFKLELTEY